MKNIVQKKVSNIAKKLTQTSGKNCSKINITPSKIQIVKIINKLQKIIFLEFFEKPNVVSLKKQLFSVRTILNKQIAIVLKFLPKYQKFSNKKLNIISKNFTFKFLQKLPKIKELLYSDLQATFDGDPAAFNKPEIIFAYPGLFAIMANRLAHELFLLGVPILPRIMTEYAHTQTGIDIHPGATIGKSICIDHGTGIVIGETAIIGNNVKIYQGVTIGALSTKGGQKLQGKKRHPTIEDNVIIYANASILGGETIIGQNSIIGGNAFITSSVPKDTKVSIKNQQLDFKQGK